MKINPHIFREYDIRGIIEQDLSAEFAYGLGRAYAAFMAQHRRGEIAVGFDCRATSEPYARAFARGAADEGLDCCITGMGPTPQLYYALHVLESAGGLQVTGSHNPVTMNGFKLSRERDTLTGEEIQELKRRMLQLDPSSPPVSRPGSIREMPLRERYTSELIENIRPHLGPRRIRIVIDAGNGVAGLVGPAAFKALGAEVIELFCQPDGTFPNHHPDPTVSENLQDLMAAVREHRADLGIGWDGDGDRLGVVDENGSIIWADMLMLLFAREILKLHPGTPVVGDVKCSSVLYDELRRLGAQPVMWKTGHSLIKQKVRETGALLGGEMAAHIVFKHRYFGFDDGIYAALRLVELLSCCSQPLSALLKDVPQMYSTPEIRVECPEEIKFRIPEMAKRAFSGYPMETLDGVRIQFDHGWALIRASNTQPVLVMRFEASTPQALQEYQDRVGRQLESIKRQCRAES